MRIMGYGDPYFLRHALYPTVELLTRMRGLIAAEIRRKREDRPAIRILLACILHARPRFPVTDLPGGALEISLAVASGAFDLAGPRNLVAVHRLRITAFPVLGACAGCIRRPLWDAAEGKHREDEKDNRKGNDSGAQEEMLHGNSGGTSSFTVRPIRSRRQEGIYVASNRSSVVDAASSHDGGEMRGERAGGCTRA